MKDSLAAICWRSSKVFSTTMRVIGEVYTSNATRTFSNALSAAVLQVWACTAALLCASQSAEAEAEHLAVSVLLTLSKLLRAGNRVLVTAPRPQRCSEASPT